MRRAEKHRRWANVAVFEDVNAGKAVETFLTGKGLEARTYDDRLFRYFLFLRPPRVTYRVQVRQNHWQEANDFLHDGAPDALQKAIHCPSCGSLRVTYPQMARNFVLPTVVLHLGIIFHVIQHECYCEDCYFDWNLPLKNIRPARKPVRQFPL